MDLSSPAFWAALGSIILANVLLSGDNAVVIAMAARGLPAHLQKRAVVLGSVAAILMRIVLTLIAVKMLALPWLKLVGGALLLWIGVNLLGEEGEDDDHAAKPIGVAAAVRTILIADLVMSLDNVLAVAAAAQGNTPLLVIGLAVSVPLIVFGSTMLLKVMERFPLIVTGGAALLGWLGGEMMLTDPGVGRALGEVPEAWVKAAGV
ncbi:MAG TPA: TerC family protein, partial [Burkholderiaceae bacterium]